MLKKLLMLCVALALSLSAGFAAAVEVNSADEAALESVKGIGPAHAKAIIDERTKNGPFKDAGDLATRVKGIGTKSVTNLETAGLTINGSSAPPSGAKPATKPATSATAKPGSPAATTPTAAPADTAATPPSATAADASSGVKASKSKKKSKADAAASGTAATQTPATASAASAPADASGTKASKKKAKKSKAASAAAASSGA